MRGGEHLIELYKRQVKRKEIGIPFDATLLISVGELSVRKNHRVVVEALQELPDNYWYVIVGKGELKDELEAMDKTGRFRLLGFRTDIVELLHCSDLFVFPSLQEGLPVALMEAMASGLPVVCSRIRGCTDLVEEQGDCMFTPESINEIRDCLDKLLSLSWDEMQQVGTYNRNKIMEFDRRIVERAMKGLYDHAVRSGE